MLTVKVSKKIHFLWNSSLDYLEYYLTPCGGKGVMTTVFWGVGWGKGLFFILGDLKVFMKNKNE